MATTRHRNYSRCPYGIVIANYLYKNTTSTLTTATNPLLQRLTTPNHDNHHHHYHLYHHYHYHPYYLHDPPPTN